MLLSTALISCAGGASGGGAGAEETSLAIRLPDFSDTQSRSLYDRSEIFSFTVSISSGTYRSTKSANKGETIVFSSIPAGACDITAYGKTSDGNIAASCVTTIQIIEGQTTSATIALSRLDYHTVKFFNNSGEEISSVRITAGYTVAEPESPAPVNGCKFDYWSADPPTAISRSPFSFNTIINADTNLYAVYKAYFRGTAAEFLAAEFASNTLETSYNVVITSATNDQIKQIGKALGKSTDPNYKGVYVNLNLRDCGSTVIPEYAFWADDSYAGAGLATYLTGITLPSTLTELGNYAIMYCSQLSGTLTIPASVSKFGYQSLDGLNNITGLVYEDTTSIWKKYKYDGTLITSGMPGFASSPFSGPTPSLSVINATSQGLTYLRKQ